MELFTGDSDVIEEDIKELLDSNNHSRNQMESLHIFNMIETLGYFYKYLDDTGYDYLSRNLYNYKDFVSKQYDNDARKEKQAINNLIMNKKHHIDFVADLMDDKDISYPISYISASNDYSISDDEMYNILTNFFRYYNIGTKILLDKLIMSRRIHKVLLNGDTRGYTISNYYNDKYHVFIGIDEDIYSMITLTHELGHVGDSKNLYSCFSKKEAYGYHKKSLFIETISSLYEKDFSDFLIHEKIYPAVVRDYLVDYYATMYQSFDYADIACNLPDKLLKNYKYRKISKEKLIDILLCIPNVEIDIDNMISPSELDPISDLKYGYGKFLGTYFSYLKKNDKDKFNDQFNRFLDIRSDYFRPDFLEYIGVNRMDAVKIVEYEINSSTSKVIVKKAS